MKPHSESAAKKLLSDELILERREEQRRENEQDAAYALITTAHADLLGEYDTRVEAEEAAEKVRGLGEQVEIIELDANGRKKSAARDRGRQVTMATAAKFEANGQYALAEIARKYAVDRPRWWHRFTRRSK